MAAAGAAASPGRSCASRRSAADRPGAESGAARGGPRFSAASAARRFIRRPRRWCTSTRDDSAGWRCRSTSPAARSGRRSRRWSSRRSCSTSACSRRRCSWCPALLVFARPAAADAADRAAAGAARRERIRRASSVRAAAGAPVLHRRAAHAHRDELLDVRAGDAHPARHDAGAGGNRRVDLSLRGRTRAASSAVRPPTASARGASSSCRSCPRCRSSPSRRCCRAGRSSRCSRSADSCCSPRCR